MGDHNSVRDADFGSPGLRTRGGMLLPLDHCLEVRAIEQYAAYYFSKECNPYCPRSLLCNHYIKQITFSNKSREKI